MARKSKKQSRYRNNELQEKEIIFHAGLYARISVENEEKRERDSIGTQVALLTDFV